MSHPETVPVEQVDREAAWPFRAECYGHGDKNGWMNGKYDHVRPIQSFARHRIAALQAAAERERAPLNEARRRLQLVQGCLDCDASDERFWSDVIDFLEGFPWSTTRTMLTSVDATAVVGNFGTER